MNDVRLPELEIGTGKAIWLVDLAVRVTLALVVLLTAGVVVALSFFGPDTLVHAANGVFGSGK